MEVNHVWIFFWWQGCFSHCHLCLLEIQPYNHRTKSPHFKRRHLEQNTNSRHLAIAPVIAPVSSFTHWLHKLYPFRWCPWWLHVGHQQPTFSITTRGSHIRMNFQEQALLIKHRQGTSYVYPLDLFNKSCKVCAFHCQVRYTLGWMIDGILMGMSFFCK